MQLLAMQRSTPVSHCLLMIDTYWPLIAHWYHWLILFPRVEELSLKIVSDISPCLVGAKSRRKLKKTSHLTKKLWPHQTIQCLTGSLAKLKEKEHNVLT